MNNNLILQTTSTIYRYAKTQDERLPKALKDFYQEGIKNPSVAKHLGYLNYGKYMLEEGQHLKDPMTRYTHGSSYIFEQLKALMFIPSRVKKVIEANEELKMLKEAFDTRLKELYTKSNYRKREIIMKAQMKSILKSM